VKVRISVKAQTLPYGILPASQSFVNKRNLEEAIGFAVASLEKLQGLL
jgi:hypothetical protein